MCVSVLPLRGSKGDTLFLLHFLFLILYLILFLILFRDGHGTVTGHAHFSFTLSFYSYSLSYSLSYSVALGYVRPNVRLTLFLTLGNRGEFIPSLESWSGQSSLSPSTFSLPCPTNALPGTFSFRTLIIPDTHLSEFSEYASTLNAGKGDGGSKALSSNKKTERGDRSAKVKGERVSTLLRYPARIQCRRARSSHGW